MCYGAPSSNDEPPPGLTLAPRALVVRILAGMFIVSFAVALVTVLIFYFRRRRNRINTSATTEHGARTTLSGTPGGDPFPVETLPAFAYNYALDRSGEHGGAATSGEHECAVCLGAVREGEMVRRLPACLHVYHVDCIDRWLAARPTCPLCRSKLDRPSKVRSDHPPLPREQDDPPDQPPA